MNGEVLHNSFIVLSAKKALRDNTALAFENEPYINKNEFRFISKNDADDLAHWYYTCLKRGLCDIKMLMPFSVKDRNLLGFSNASQNIILCFFGDGKVTYFTPLWSFDNDKKKWNIVYSEHSWENPPKEKPVFKNNAEELAAVLREIKDFAVKIGFGNFADIFQKSLGALEETYSEKTKKHRFFDFAVGKITQKSKKISDNEDSGYGYAKYLRKIEFIPEENQRLFKAAGLCDVFGAMGSWNDSPPYAAHKMGLDEEYERLSAELLKQMRLAALFAVNEW